jgi:hypothetical protein
VDFYWEIFAFLKLNKYSAKAKEQVLDKMSGLKEHLSFMYPWYFGDL